MVSTAIKIAVSLVWVYCCFAVIAPRILHEAYDIRLEAIKEYGPIIHEFDPYFNFRATEYLFQHGAKKFFQWFDYMVWYPLGRPVGTTIYPGMQFTAVFIKKYIVGDRMSLNDVCCYVPAWFGALATLVTGLLAYECSIPIVSETDNGEEPFGSILECIPGISFLYKRTFQPVMKVIFETMEKFIGTDFGLRHNTVMPGHKGWVDVSSPAVEIALVTGMVMSIIPAHLMRSMGGGFDNESVAMFAMVLTFYMWTRSLRGGMKVDSAMTWVWGAGTGLAYFNMVAAWGGYVFVINLIGCHAAILVLLGRFSTKVYRAYTAFYIVGTLLAIQVPVVGWAPLKSLEQLGPCAVFLGFQLLQYCESQRKRNKLSFKEAWLLRIKVFGVAAMALVALATYLRYMGYFGPISARVRGLFVKHTKTGNPLVDSVAEHQPAQASAYNQYLGSGVVNIIPIGFMLVALRYFHDASSFLLVYGVATYFFSLKMVRLILLTAPIASVFTGLFIGRVIGLLLYNVLGFVPSIFHALALDEDEELEDDKANERTRKKNKKGKKVETKQDDEDNKANGILSSALLKSAVIRAVFAYLCYFSFAAMIPEAKEFYAASHSIAKHLANPTIVQKGTLKSGETVLVDDYRECYYWIRDNTPEDSRIMAWWDYGYQITAIANRTTIADGNTWNHEHIALLGRALTSAEKEGHRIARHLADYILVWAGGGGDDVAKSPHLARIANSVYRNMCPGDPVCSKFGYTKEGRPSKMMRESMLFKLHSHGLQPGVVADPNRFREVFSSKFGKCRVFKILSVSKESKDWVADPANRKCDAPGSWYCPGQYPPSMQKILKEKRDFSQLEDFNKREKDNEYQKQYFANLERKKSGQLVDEEAAPKKKAWKPNVELSQAQIDEINKVWEDNPTTSMMWEIISNGHVKELIEMLTDYPELAHSRSADGRGPMFWAMEYGNEKIIRVLKKVGVSTTVKDAKGLTPLDLKKKTNEL